MVVGMGEQHGSSWRRFERAAEALEAARAELDAAAELALSENHTYAELGRVLGISRQAARKRWPGLSSY